MGCGPPGHDHDHDHARPAKGHARPAKGAVKTGIEAVVTPRPLGECLVAWRCSGAVDATRGNIGGVGDESEKWGSGSNAAMANGGGMAPRGGGGGARALTSGDLADITWLTSTVSRVAAHTAHAARSSISLVSCTIQRRTAGLQSSSWGHGDMASLATSGARVQTGAGQSHANQ